MYTYIAHVCSKEWKKYFSAHILSVFNSELRYSEIKQIDEGCNAHLVYFVHHTDYEMRPSCSSFMFLKLGVENIFEIIPIILKMKFICQGCRRSGRCLWAHPSSWSGSCLHWHSSRRFKFGSQRVSSSLANHWILMIANAVKLKIE